MDFGLQCKMQTAEREQASLPRGLKVKISDVIMVGTVPSALTKIVHKNGKLEKDRRFVTEVHHSAPSDRVLNFKSFTGSGPPPCTGGSTPDPRRGREG